MPSKMSQYNLFNGTAARNLYSGLDQAVEQAVEQAECSYEANPPGMAVIDKQGNVYVGAGNQPEAHIREARNMQEVVRNYLSSEEGERFISYVRAKGKKFINIKGVGAADLGERTVAALLKNDLEGIILSNYSGRTFNERVRQLAEEYGTDEKSMTEYVIAHELAHAAGYTKEAEAERFLKDYFTTQAFQSKNKRERAKYVKLAAIAEKREKESSGGKVKSKG